MTLNKLSLLEQAASQKVTATNLPNSSKIVEALLDAEKLARKEKISYAFADLIGCWNLRFITGTKKSRQKAGIVLGAGRYIPGLIKIQITYELDSASVNQGRVINSVKIAFLNLALSGPVEFLPQKNILAFDFTSLTFKLGGRKIYDNYLKNGAIRDKEFYQKKLADRAFFSYFLIQSNSQISPAVKLIAARGKGGGLALWGRDIQV